MLVEYLNKEVLPILQLHAYIILSSSCISNLFVLHFQNKFGSKAVFNRMLQNNTAKLLSDQAKGNTNKSHSRLYKCDWCGV